MKLTKEQGIILTGHLGHLCCKFSDFHEDAERRLDRPILTHEFGDRGMAEMLKELYRDDFLSIMPTEVSEEE